MKRTLRLIWPLLLLPLTASAQSIDLRLGEPEGRTTDPAPDPGIEAQLEALFGPTPEPFRLPSVVDLLQPPSYPTHRDTGEGCEPVNAVKLLTWNVGTIAPHSLRPWSLRLPPDRESRLIETIRWEKAQVVTLQEVQDLEQIERLQARLLEKDGWPWHATTTRVDERRDDGRLIATLTRDRPEVRQFRDSASNFGAHAVILPRCTVINIHGPSVSAEHRTQFYGALIDWAAELPQPVIVAGDFNLGPNRGAGSAAIAPASWEVRREDKATFAALIEAFPVHTRQDGSTTSYGLLLDHVLATDGRVITQRAISTLTEFPQDHYPLAVYLSFEEPLSQTEATARFGMAGALQAAGR